MARLVVLLFLLAAPLRIDSTDALFAAVTVSPANQIATGSGTWFSGTGTGTAICVGINVALACPFGLQSGVGRVTANITLLNKVVATTYTLTVVDGTGPAGISTIVTATFAASGSATVTLAAGATDTIRVLLRTRGNTPRGTYTGSLRVTDSTSGLSVLIPLSVTH